MAGRKKIQPEPGRRSARLQAKNEQTTQATRQRRKRKETPAEKTEAETRAKRVKKIRTVNGDDQAKDEAAHCTDKHPHHEHNHDHAHGSDADGGNVRHVLDAHTRNLLPSSWFGTAGEIWARGIWTLEKENAMREELEASPQYARFLEQQTHFYAHQEPSGLYLEAELRLAEILQHRYRCNLDDLFRYGLRPDVSNGTTSRNTASYPYASHAYLVKLACILVYPMWNGIAVVRWMLQRVVQERVPGHARPLVPPASYWKLPFVSVARQWGAAVAVAEEGAEGIAKGRGGESKAAEDAADAAEAEMAWFMFSTDTPRDLWMLDEMLQHDEPGYDEEDGSDDKGDDKESVASNTSSDSSCSHLTVCSAIKEGRFGHISGSFSGCDISARQDKLRREDHLTARTRGLKRTPNVVSADMTDAQVFFDLQERDLDRLLALLSDEQFMVDSGLALPRSYYNGYIRTHSLLGHGHKSEGLSRGTETSTSTSTSTGTDTGTGTGTGTDSKEQPLLTCSRCAQEYHQGTRHPRDVNVNKDGHVHFLHQQFVRDNPERMFDWLRQSKLEWLAAGVREARINAALREDIAKTTSGGAHGKGRLLQLPDVPPYDPAPMGHLDNVFTHPSQLEVMKRASLGDRPHASVLWCLQGQWDE